MAGQILVNEKEQICTITLNRPDSMNALSRQMVTELESAADRLETSRSVRFLILTGSQKAFCAGADLKERAGMQEQEVHEFLDRLGSLFRRIEKLKFPTLSAINGYAFGGGLELALCTDFRLMAQSAMCGLTETSLGIIPGAGGTQRLSRVAGRQSAKNMILRALKISAEQAYQYGVADEVTKPEELLERAHAIAKEILSNAPVALELAKQAIDEGLTLPVDQALALERKYYNQTLSTEDRTEALKAFREKRKPVFKGK